MPWLSPDEHILTFTTNHGFIVREPKFKLGYQPVVFGGPKGDKHMSSNESLDWHGKRKKAGSE